MSATGKKSPVKWWRVFRICFRWTRIAILFAILGVICALTYVSEVGLPDFLKRPLLQSLETRGVELRFSRLRWRWARGFVAEDVRFGSALPLPDIPQLSLREVELRLDSSQLYHLKFAVNGLNLGGGKLSWPLLNPSQPSSVLNLTNLDARLRLLPGDEWVLDGLSAVFENARFSLTGSITNASMLKTWPIFSHGAKKSAPGSFGERLRQFAEAMHRVHFASQPQLNVIVHGDAANTSSFDAFVILHAPGVSTPWCDVSKGDLLLRLSPPPSGNGPSKLEFRLDVAAVKTAYAEASQVHAEIHALGDDGLTNLVHATLEFSAVKASTLWADVGTVSASVQWSHSLTNPLPADGVAKLTFSDIETQWATASHATLTASLRTPAISVPSQPELGFWNTLAPYVLGLESRVENIRAGDFESREVAISGNWKAPMLTITNLYTEMYQGHFKADADINVSNRKARLALNSDFDALRAYPLLPPAAQRWLDHQRFDWVKPPVIQAAGTITLPEWTNRHPDWHGEIMPTLALNGHFELGEGSYRGVSFTNASSHIIFSNMTWCMPDMLARRPEGAVQMFFTSDDRTQDYFFKVHSGMNVQPIRTVLENEKARQVFDKFTFGTPAEVTAEIWGRWHEPTRTGFTAHIAATNLTYKTESATAVSANLQYTNKFLLLTHSRAEQTNLFVTVESMGFDLTTLRGHLTNGFSTIDPMVIARLIGPRTAESFMAYHFVVPPQIRADGEVPLTEDVSVSDMHFAIEGGPFDWWKFHLPRIRGKAHWVGDELFLEDMDADFYGGNIQGSAKFDFDTEMGTDASFDVEVKDTMLQLLLADVATSTNHLEGTLNGNLQITRGNTADRQSWFGSGHAQLKDGLIWNIPIFGILTPLLNTLSPGLGESRAGQGTADFVITNSVIRTDNLEVRSPTLRLFYRGTVDFDLKVDAKVDAEIGRDAPLVGEVVSVMLYPFGKMFETRVTGTLGNPKREPVMWLTRAISPLLHPWRVFNFLIPKTSGETNAPAVPANEINPNTTKKP